MLRFTIALLAILLFGKMVTAQTDWNPAFFATNAKALQQRLKDLGFNAGDVDGYPGPQTRNALMAFQVKHCLPPTGQPTPQTSLALSSASYGVFPCPDAHMPAGITANTPLKTGVFVSDLSFCETGKFNYEQAPDVIRVINGLSLTFGIHGSCKTRRTDIDQGKTLYKGTCYIGPEAFKTIWRLNILAPTKFVEILGYYEGTAGIVFEKCPEDSKLRRDYEAWFTN